QVHLASTDASELQRVVITSGLAPSLEDKLTDYGIDLAGNLDFNGTVRGSLDDPLVNGRVSLGSLMVNGRNLGTLTASIESDANATRIPDGRLTQANGGNAQFALNIPRAGPDNVTLESLNARVTGGALQDNAPVDIESKRFDLRAQGQNVRLDLLTGLTGAAGVPNLAGTADFAASASGDYDEPRSYKIELNGTVHDVAINGQPAGTLAIVGHTEGQQFKLQLTTGLLGQPQVNAATVAR